jgi:carbonic anhydrase/acetyltransferase-like protein (isoleucine patch superfamily)
MIRAYRGILPKIAQSAYVDRSAQVIGDVIVGERASVWCNTSIRGDVNTITIGDDSNVQDNTVMHGELNAYPVVVGKRVTIGHSAVIHGCVIEDDCLIGIGSIILNGARVGMGTVIAAGALVPEEMQIPPNSMVMGVPAKIRRQVTDEEHARFRENAQRYLKYREAYRDEPA